MTKRSSKSATKATANQAPEVDRTWQARSDLDALRRAGEVVSDRSRMAAAQNMHRKEMAGMQKVMGKTPSLNLDKKG